MDSVGTLTDFEHVLVHRTAPAARIVLNRPEKRNALSLALMHEVIQALEELARDPEVRAIVIEGSGPGFSGGHDLAEMTGRDLPFFQELFDVCTQMMEMVHRVPQPVIAISTARAHRGSSSKCHTTTTPAITTRRSISGSINAPSRLYWPVTRAAMPSR